jgi:hypothetical protein
MTHYRAIVPVFALAACTTPVADVGGLTGDSGGNPSTGVSVGSTSGGNDGTTTAVGETGPAPLETSSSDDSSGGAEGPVLDVGAADTGGVVDCDEAAPKLIHVLNTDNEIWTFDPIALQYELLTAVDCPQIEGYPTGFSIDRNNLITVLSAEPFVPDFDNYPVMKLTRFTPGDADCEELFYGAVEEDGLFIDCGDLTLVSMLDDPDHERLFAAACTGGGFALAQGPVFRLDPADAVPEFTLLADSGYTSMPVTGTGDGRLFGISGDQSVPGSTTLLEFDQDNGTVLGLTPIPEIDLGEFGAYFALAFYGGDLYTFGREFPGGTVVHRYDLDDADGNGEHEVTPIPEAANHPFAGGILAAASPTCIPLTPEG